MSRFKKLCGFPVFGTVPKSKCVLPVGHKSSCSERVTPTGYDPSNINMGATLDPEARLDLGASLRNSGAGLEYTAETITGELWDQANLDPITGTVHHRPLIVTPYDLGSSDCDTRNNRVAPALIEAANRKAHREPHNDAEHITALCCLLDVVKGSAGYRPDFTREALLDMINIASHYVSWLDEQEQL